MKKSAKPIKIIIFLFVASFLSAADCNVGQKEETSYLSEEFKSYVIFQEGSYWIYQNENGFMDTVTVEKIVQDIKDSPYFYPFEQYDITLSSSINGKKKYLARSQDLNRTGCDNYGIDYYADNYLNNYFLFCCCEAGVKSKNLTFAQELDTLLLNDIVFTNVKLFKSDTNYSYVHKSYYYAPYIGLIKYIDSTDNHWIIKDYEANNILQ